MTYKEFEDSIQFKLGTWIVLFAIVFFAIKKIADLIGYIDV